MVWAAGPGGRLAAGALLWLGPLLPTPMALASVAMVVLLFGVNRTLPPPPVQLTDAQVSLQGWAGILSVQVSPPPPDLGKAQGGESPNLGFFPPPSLLSGCPAAPFLPA